MDNQGYIFKNYFDATCYLVISIIYPVLTYMVQSSAPIVEKVSKLSLITTGLFFTASFFYDYYQRYRDCNEQTEGVVNVLFFGRMIFFIFMILSFWALIVFSNDFFVEIEDEVMMLCKYLPFMAAYPFGTALIEIMKRMHLERKGKITSVRV